MCFWFAGSAFRYIFPFVFCDHVFELFLYTLRILRAFSRFILHFPHCFCIIQIRNPEYLIVYLALSTPQRKTKHSTYNNMKEGDFLMKYGHFDDVHQEYVITTPKTPLPWINYLGCNDFFSLISNTCGGYTFYKDAKLLRLTRYRYNNVPADINGKYLYIKDGDTVWNPGWQPTKTELDSYECRHGIGYSRFTSSKNSVKASVLSFVPLNDNCEISQLTLTNGSSEDKKLSVFSYVEWCLWNADDDMKNFQRNLSTGEVEVQDSTIYHKTEYRERRNHYAIYSVNTKIDGFDTSRDAFLGAYRGADSPEAVENGKCTNSMASGWSPIASHQINVDLAAGETKTFIFVLGYIENPEDEKWESYGVINKTRAKEMLAKYQTDAQVEDAFAALQAYWKQLLARYTVASADEKVNRMVNTWNQYQCMVTFNMSRSASYYGITGLSYVSTGTCNEPQRIIVEAAADIGVAFLGQRLILMVSTAVLELGGSDINDTLSCTVRDQMYETEQILAGITEAHTTADSGLVIRSGTGHVKGYHTLVLVPDICHTVYVRILALYMIAGEKIILWGYDIGLPEQTYSALDGLKL